MMRSAWQHAQQNLAPRGKAVTRVRAAIRRLRPVAFAYLADRAYGG